MAQAPFPDFKAIRARFPVLSFVALMVSVLLVGCGMPEYRTEPAPVAAEPTMESTDTSAAAAPPLRGSYRGAPRRGARRHLPDGGHFGPGLDQARHPHPGRPGNEIFVMGEHLGQQNHGF